MACVRFVSRARSCDGRASATGIMSGSESNGTGSCKSDAFDRERFSVGVKPDFDAVGVVEPDEQGVIVFGLPFSGFGPLGEFPNRRG